MDIKPLPTIYVDLQLSARKHYHVVDAHQELRIFQKLTDALTALREAGEDAVMVVDANDNVYYLTVE